MKNDKHAGSLFLKKMCSKMESKLDMIEFRLKEQNRLKGDIHGSASQEKLLVECDRK